MNEISVDGRTTYGHYVMNIRHSYSGGYVLKSNILPYPEIGTSPLQITA
jgi:hypothetical protein